MSAVLPSTPKGEALDEASVNELIEPCVDGQRLTLVVVGPAGVGKSTIVNTLTMKPLCKDQWQAAPVTPHLKTVSFPVPLKQGRRATVSVYDSPGFTGKKKNDRNAANELEKKKPEADAILVCFDLLANSGRYMPMVHGVVMEKIADVFGEEVLKKKAVIVLTKGNMVSDFVTHKRTSDLVDEWRREFREDQEDLAEVQIFVAGRGLFEESGDMTHLSLIDDNWSWFDDLWNAVATIVSEQPGLATLMCVLHQQQPQKFKQANGQRTRQLQEDEQQRRHTSLRVNPNSPARMPAAMALGLHGQRRYPTEKPSASDRPMNESAFPRIRRRVLKAVGLFLHLTLSLTLPLVVGLTHGAHAVADLVLNFTRLLSPSLVESSDGESSDGHTSD